MSYQLSSTEEKNLKDIQTAYYMPPVLQRIDLLLKEKIPKSYVFAFNKVYQILRESETEVRQIIQERKKQGKIKNVDQTVKSVVGNIFPRSIIYLFLQNKIVGNIKEDIFITSKPKQVKGFDEISIINIGDTDTQKPDCDLIIYSYHSDKFNKKNLRKCIILSLKTSMRERAAQTYKWKLLLEIANDQGCAVREKYGISYDVPQIPLICFVTVNFYNEINNPQQRGMLKFFDRAFLAKELSEPSDFINPMSDIVEFVNEEFTDR
ncbi:BsaWI family type II restriction enzyme [[Limnothrix rosea] IAM M-220]|uniref:BsaWI family type II restriction enzyme n=1 Tax=[Limnothrix rosea] IAM M-220 TaxID=454133 RepID=UPI00095EE145|nr:BsaWI family type II restriction enzyme [[Limnothrix rosea] IAM M-220]OKH19097.1 hypothetical protein NIES208_03775 [[Limnothrix rosea] IAM M-220]